MDWLQHAFSANERSNSIALELLAEYLTVGQLEKYITEL